VKNSQARTNSAIPRSRSWIGATIVILATVFLLLTLNEGRSGTYQPTIHALFHNCVVTGFIAVTVWLARRAAFNALPFWLSKLSAVVMTYFALFSSVALFVSQPFWDLMKLFGVNQNAMQPAAVLGVIWLWGIYFIGLFVRGVYRWFRKRYVHHGFGIGIGPVYVYFRRRRISH
jgi:hypothetical protein